MRVFRKTAPVCAFLIALLASCQDPVTLAPQRHGDGGQLTGGGLTKVTHDGTLSGNGTNASTLSVIGVSGTLACTSVPALTGDVTTAGGTCADAIATNAVTNAKFRQGAATSVVGNSTGSTANVADIAASADGQVLTRSGGVITWLTRASPFASTGYDGSLNFDGSSTITLGDGTTLVPASSVYTLARDILPTNITVATGVTIVGAGWRIIASGTATLTGTAKFTDNGAAGTGSAVGAARAAGFWPATLAGGGATASGTVPWPYWQTAAATTTNGNGATGQGGAGGAGTNGAGNGGALTASLSTQGPTSYLSWFTGKTTAGATALTFATSGGSGGTGADANSGKGGASAGVAMLVCKTLSGSGTVEAKGGNGGNSTSSGNGGGGGGGGGGFVILDYQTANGTVAGVVTGGSAGTATGTGHIGGTGGNGTTLRYSGDGT